MSNMSYCRFQNTASGLSDCEGALDELFESSCDELSESETAAAERLINYCFRITEKVARSSSLSLAAFADMPPNERRAAIKQVMADANAACVDERELDEPEAR